MKHKVLKHQLLLLLTLVFALHGRAQNKTLVYGDLGMENVNISVLNTQNGTISDAKGRYKLLLTEKNKRINLHFLMGGVSNSLWRWFKNFTGGTCSQMMQVLILGPDSEQKVLKDHQ